MSDLDRATQSFLDVFDYTLDSFHKSIREHCDKETAERILRCTRKDLKKIMPQVGNYNGRRKA